MSTTAHLITVRNALTSRLQAAAEVVPPAVLRLVMGWEFWESGLEKLHGDNWFADIQGKFPWPFDVIPAGLSWALATGFELAGAVMLWLGLGTRLFAFSLMFLTFVATAAVHWPTCGRCGAIFSPAMRSATAATAISSCRCCSSSCCCR
ncbi:DoxX family protein [Tahibacter sp. UC22_41]|uniref:HvfX family Cu-binding RiPP maturation protein n=1 Tax=Tahibacter sp. UC22_41 TaxID=3350178 RepID=UPI0036DF1424